MALSSSTVVSAATAGEREKGSLSVLSEAGMEPMTGSINQPAGVCFCTRYLRLRGKRLAQGHTADSRQN